MSDADNNSTPSDNKTHLLRLNSNRWIRLIVYSLACLCTSCIYFGWQDYSMMMIRSGAYEWKCDHDNCLAQEKAVAALYSWANGSEFLCAALAGFLLDTFGPRKTAAIGEILHFLSTILLIFSSQSFPMYVPALILAGACVNVITFPSLTVMELWPGRQAFAVSIMVGCQSAASIIAPTLREMWDRNPSWTFRGIWLVWLAVVWLPVSSLYLICLPRRRNFDLLLTTSIKPIELSRIDSVVDLKGHLVSADSVVPQSGQRYEHWTLFIASLSTLDIWMMVLFCGLLMFQFAYYPSVVRDAISDKISELLGWLTPLQGPFSFVIGFCMDYTGTTLVMAIMCLSLIFVNESSAWGPQNDALQKSVTFWFVFIQSATYNVKYTFVNEMYDPYNFGKLVGVLGIAGGLGVYCSGPLVKSTEYKLIFNVLTIAAIFMLCLTSVITVRQNRGVTHKTKSPESTHIVHTNEHCVQV